MFIGFDTVRGHRREALTHDKKNWGKLQIRILLTHVFGFAELQENATNWVRKKVTVKKTEDKAELLVSAPAIAGKLSKTDFSWYKRQHTPNAITQSKFTEHLTAVVPTEMT